MSRPKSEYKSGIGKAVRAFTALVEAVEDIGGGDEDIRRLETDQDLRRQLADLIVGTYELPVNFDDPQWKMIDRGRYAFVGDVTVDDDYPITETGTKTVRFRELVFDHDPTDQEVLDLAEQLNCRQLNRAEAETVIRKKYTSEELGRNPRIGLIGPAVQRDGGLGRAYVHGLEGGVSLGWRLTEDRWRRLCRFVVACK